MLARWLGLRRRDDARLGDPVDRADLLRYSGVSERSITRTEMPGRMASNSGFS